MTNIYLQRYLIVLYAFLYNMVNNGSKMDAEHYEELFGINKKEKTPSDKQKLAFVQVSDIRKFEIEMYWKRAAYFWTIIAITFTGYFALSSIGNLQYKSTYSLLLSSMGTVFTFSWYLVNRGSKYWQENWENHLDLMEDEITGPLYKTILERPTSDDLKKNGLGKDSIVELLVTGPASISVSKINQWVALYILLIWTSITLVNFVSIIAPSFLKENDTLEIIAAVFTISLSILIMCMMTIKGGTHKKPHNPKIKKRETKVFY